jgi:hypothetical protein
MEKKGGFLAGKTYRAPAIGKAPECDFPSMAGDSKNSRTTSVWKIPFFIIFKHFVAAPSSTRVFENGGMDPKLRLDPELLKIVTGRYPEQQTLVSDFKEKKNVPGVIPPMSA